jgi:hypothetical protein
MILITQQTTAKRLICSTPNGAVGTSMQFRVDAGARLLMSCFFSVRCMVPLVLSIASRCRFLWLMFWSFFDRILACLSLISLCLACNPVGSCSQLRTDFLPSGANSSYESSAALLSARRVDPDVERPAQLPRHSAHCLQGALIDAAGCQYPQALVSPARNLSLLLIDCRFTARV